ncbi:hypothetical protein AC068_01440 [Morganella morganii]|nr:hypothetical protein AC068_01440 [Morganella morganii]
MRVFFYSQDDGQQQDFFPVNAASCTGGQASFLFFPYHKPGTAVSIATQLLLNSPFLQASDFIVTPYKTTRCSSGFSVTALCCLFV